jgi:hypothetical protein
MTSERANRLTGGHRWNETNERCVVCLMSRRESTKPATLVRASIVAASSSTCPRMTQIKAMSEADPAATEKTSPCPRTVLVGPVIENDGNF